MSSHPFVKKISVSCFSGVGEAVGKRFYPCDALGIIMRLITHHKTVEKKNLTPIGQMLSVLMKRKMCMDKPKDVNIQTMLGSLKCRRYVEIVK